MDFSKVKLKKTVVVDKSGPKLSGYEDATAVQDKSLDINIERWIDLLKSHTFETKFVPLSQEDGQFFCESYLLLRDKKELTPELAEKKKELINRLNLVIDELKGEHDCVFVKTSCRSAKDTTLYHTRFDAYYKQSIAKSQRTPTVNDKIASLLEAGLEALKTHDAESLFNTFLVSERVYQDFELALSRPERWEQNLAVRRWNPIHVGMEFRGYVKNGRLCAVSQYNYVAYFQILKDRKEAIQSRIIQFFYDECHEDYIIDFGMIGENYDKVVIIELNEFMDTTDGCMFKWATERALLEHEPLTFRIVEDPIDEAMNYLSPEWKRVAFPDLA